MIPSNWSLDTKSGKKVIVQSMQDRLPSIIVPPTHYIYSLESLDAIEQIGDNFYYTYLLYDYRNVMKNKTNMKYNAILMVEKMAKIDRADKHTGETIDTIEALIFVDSRKTISSGVTMERSLSFFSFEKFLIGDTFLVGNSRYTLSSVDRQFDRDFYNAKLTGGA